MKPQKPIQIRQFVYGRIGEVADFLLPDGAITTAKNVHFDEIGRVKKRLGVALIGSQISDTKPCLGLYYFQSATAANSQLLSVFSDGTNNDVYYNNAGTWTKTLQDDTKALKTRFTTFLNQVIRVNGTDNATAWFGTGAWGQNAGTGANDLNLDDMDSYDCSLVEAFKQRVYMAGWSTVPDRLFYSIVATSDPYITFAPTTDFVDINPNDGDNLTALKRYALELLCFKNRFLYRYYGLAGVDPEPLIKIGTPSQEAVVEAKNGAYFFSETPAIYRYTGNQPKEISRPVRDFLEAIPSTYFATVSSWVEADGDHVCFSIGDVTVAGVSWTNVVLRFTISSQVWTVYSYGTEIRRGCIWDNGTNNVAVVGDDDGNVFTFNSGNQDLNSSGTAIAIPYELVTKWFELGALSETGFINKLSAVCKKAQGAILAWQEDDKAEWHTLNQLKQYLTFFKNVKVKGHRIRFKLYGSSSVDPFSFEGIELLQLANKGTIE